jgi:hypothetical protein
MAWPGRVPRTAAVPALGVPRPCSPDGRAGRNRSAMLPRIRADGSPAGPRPRPQARHRPAPPAPGATRAAAVTARRPPCAAPQRRRSGGATACRRSPARRPRRRAGRCCAPALAAAAILIITLHSAQLAQRNVTLIGFPGGSKAPLVCPSATTKGFDGRFLEIACDNFAPGVSGGPFLRNFDGKRGDIIGVIGGYKTGGSRDDISCSSQFDSDVVRLCNQAVNDYEPGGPMAWGTQSCGDMPWVLHPAHSTQSRRSSATPT